jgi:enamine deaminase RidA (YjgF/YER057c/UK114 family)
VLQRVPGDGLAPAELHAVLDGTPYAAAAEFADWIWGQTDLIFLDCDDEMEVVDAEWSDDNVQELTRQWQTAGALMDRVTALEIWLERDPARHFAQLLEAALAPSADVVDTAERSAHAQEVSRCESANVPVHARLTIPPPAAA